MLRWIQGVSLREHKRNEEIREAATVQPITTHLVQKRLRWYGHVRRIEMIAIIAKRNDTDSAGYGGRRCVTERKTKTKIYGHHQKRHEEESSDRRQHS